jgi:SAM-dependent methyltransferase
MIKYMPYRPRLRVLDCGCGEGILLDQLRGRTEAAWGIDRSQRALGEPQVPGTVSIAQMAALPFDAASFDVVFGLSAMRRARDPSCALREMARILRPGGRLILWEPRWLFRRVPAAELWRQIGSAGLQVVRAEPIDYLAYPVSLLASAIPLVSRSHLAHTLTKALLAADGLLGRVPTLCEKSWHLIIVADKNGSKHVQD